VKVVRPENILTK